jgi:hypothetical protein
LPQAVKPGKCTFFKYNFPAAPGQSNTLRTLYLQGFKCSGNRPEPPTLMILRKTVLTNFLTIDSSRTNRLSLRAETENLARLFKNQYPDALQKKKSFFLTRRGEMDKRFPRAAYGICGAEKR